MEGTRDVRTGRNVIGRPFSAAAAAAAAAAALRLCAPSGEYD